MNCEQASLYYYDVLENAGTLNPAAAEHVNHCPACQGEIDRLRQALRGGDGVEKPWRPGYLDLHYQLLDRWVSCRQVRPLLPSLCIEQMSVTAPTPITAHIDKCPACRQALDKIASLGLHPAALVPAGRYLADETLEKTELDPHVCRTLDAVRKDKVSNILTRMRLTEAADTQLQSTAYTVDVRRRQIASVPAAQRSHRRPVSAWVAGGVAAAVLFAILLVLPAGDVQALDVDQLYMTLDTVRNVRIHKFNDTQDLETIWISEGLGGVLFKQSDAVVFVNKKSGNTYRQHQGTVQLVSRGGGMDFERPWGLLPFRNISAVPASYEWEHIGDSELENGQQVRIYEWRWAEQVSDRLTIQHIWRGYLDARSYLPYRVESLDKIGDAAVELIMEMQISYPTDEQCREIFEQYGFEGLVYGVQEEAFNRAPPLSNAGSIEAGLVLSTWPSAKAAFNDPE